MTSPTGSIARRRLVQRVRALGIRRWLLLAESVMMLAAASAVIRFVPFRNVVQFASRRFAVAHSSRDNRSVIADTVWAIEAAARRVPWRTVCFQKGLALHAMLRSRGIATFLHYGVGKGDDFELAAHVWISVDGRIVMGQDVVDRFRCLATYPPLPDRSGS